MSSGFDSQWLRDREARTVKLGAAPPDAETDESKLHAKIVEECKRRGWICLHGSMVEKTSRPIGEWDFTLVADQGRVFFFECKSKTGKLTPEQAGMIGWAIKLGHRVAVVRSFEEFVSVITTGFK